MAQPQQQQHREGGRGGGTVSPPGKSNGHQQHPVSEPQQMVFPQGVQFFIPGQQNIMQYGGLSQQQQPQYPLAYQNVMVRPPNQLYQPTNTFQPTAAAFLPTTNQSQNQGLFRQPQKPAQQPAAEQQTQQQPLKREKKALLIINPDTNKPLNADSPTTNKAPSKSPEPEPLVPLVSPTTDANREFQQKIGLVSAYASPNANIILLPKFQHQKKFQEESQSSGEPNKEEAEKKTVDNGSEEEEEIQGETSDDSANSRQMGAVSVSEKSCPVQGASSGRLKYDREYLLSFRFLRECKEPPKDLILDSNRLEFLRRSKHDDPIRRDAFLPPFSTAGLKRQSKDRGRGKRGQHCPHSNAVQTAAVEKSELTESEKVWERSSEVTARSLEDDMEADELYCKFQRILDNLTPQKFQKLAEQAKELAEKMDTPERMSGCIEKIVIKALEEPVFSVVYAKLCLVLTPYKVQVTGEDGQLKMKSFRALLLTKLQQEFEKDKEEDEELERLKAAIEAAESEEEKKARKDEYNVAEFKSRHRSLGNIKFIGELFNFKLLSEAIIHECIQRLLKSTSDGESLECFAKLMTTVGKELDHDKGKNLMDRYFARVDHIIEASKIGSRVKFMLQDVVDLRKNTWVPRKIVASNVPTTIDKLHADHHQQAEEMKRILSVQPNRPRQPPGDSRRRDDYSSDGRQGVQQPHTPEKLETDRLRRLGNRPKETATKHLGPSTWLEPQKVKSGGRSSKGKKTAGPAPSGSRRSATQLIATEARKEQKNVIAAVALQTGYKVQPTPVVSDALSEEDVEKKSESHSLQFLSYSSPPAIQVHSGVLQDKQQEWIHRLRHKLSSPENTNDNVVSFIEKHHSEHCHSPPFIYSLSCALVDAGVSGSGDNVVYKSDLLERRCPVLKHLVDHHSNLQIDIIYGLQVTLSKKQHPKGILDKLFTLLYDQDVIGEDAFTLWEEGGREDLEGRKVALMSAKPFMDWLRSVDGQDGQ